MYMYNWFYIIEQVHLWKIVLIYAKLYRVGRGQVGIFVIDKFTVNL